jgi:hypothetical protein
MLTRELVATALPATMKSAATQALVDQINTLVSDPIAAENIRENFISYTKVLIEGKFKMEDYLHAIAYVSYKHMGYSNQEAYFRAFPSRHQNLVAKGTSNKDISAYVAAYHKGKLVNLIMEQSLVPMWILNQDAYQKAINTQVEIMDDLNAPAIARTAAANSVLTHLAKPKDAVSTIKFEVTENSGMNEIRGMLTQLAQKQIGAIEGGASVKEIASQRIIEGVVADVGTD